jgi:hypothetical protein
VLAVLVLGVVLVELEEHPIREVATMSVQVARARVFRRLFGQDTPAD